MKFQSATLSSLYSATANAGTGTAISASGFDTMDYSGEMLVLLAIGSGSGAGNKVQVTIQECSGSGVDLAGWSNISGGVFASQASQSITDLHIDKTYLKRYVRPILYQTGSLAVNVSLFADKQRLTS